LGQIFNNAPEKALWSHVAGAVPDRFPGVAITCVGLVEPNPLKSSLGANTSPLQVEHWLTVTADVSPSRTGRVDHPMPAVRADPSYDLIGDGLISEISPLNLHADPSAHLRPKPIGVELLDVSHG
jgi:hypothetical protein